jgi:hypothetical protein
LRRDLCREDNAAIPYDGASSTDTRDHFDALQTFRSTLSALSRRVVRFTESVLASSLRPKLLINGEPTLELDFASCQLRLMYALVGLPDPLHGQIRTSDPTFDLYAIEGLDRDVVKLAVLIIANAGSVRSARRALGAKLISEPPENRSREAKRILAAVQSHFPALEPLWCSGVGLRLQRADSNLCEQIQREMCALGIPTLSIHDSFISWRRVEQELRAAMQNAFIRTWENCQIPP